MEIICCPYSQILINKCEIINSQSLEDTQVGYTSGKYMYIFLKSIAAIIHFQALMDPYTREPFRPPYTPRSIYAFLQPQISVCIPLRPSVYIFEEHCCHHTFPSIAASIQPNPRSIQASIHPWLISPHHSDQMSQRSQFSADALWQSRDADRIEI